MMIRRLVRTFVSVLLGLILISAWLVLPTQVETGSMAPALLGRRHEIVCDDCGWSFACDANHDQARRVACPRCGFMENQLAATSVVAGDRLLVDRTAFWRRGPRRGEVIAFRCPHQPHRVCIKRVLGLPGETVSLRGGDLYIDGAIQPKSLAELKAVAMPVHDAGFIPSAGDSDDERWRGTAGVSRWRATRDARGQARFDHPVVTSEDADAAPPTVDWLTYHHRAPVGDDPTAPWVESPVLDDAAYNVDRPWRRFVCTDLLLTCRLRTEGEGLLLLRITDGRDEFLTRIDPRGGRAELFQNGQVIAESESSSLVEGQTAEVSMALVDHRFLLAFDGQLVFAPVEYRSNERPGDGPPGTPRPLDVGSMGLEVSLWDLQVGRDLYYTAPPPAAGPRRGAAAGVHLAENHYFVLGDNSPLSLDSRNWPAAAGLPGNLLLGKPLLVHYPSRRVDWLGIRFQVPRLSGIRYIRTGSDE